jgi:16S rRNA (guanine527-N7)-methyltransferase
MMHLLEETASSWGLQLSAEQLAQFATYAAELQRWNEKLNLTSVTDAQTIVTRHFIDSLRCALSWEDAPARLADIGTGAGFPGLPLKILRPDMQITLVESIEKKAAFLRHLSTTLGLDGVTVLTARAEAIGRDPQHRECYDVVTARAVAELRVLVEYCLPLCRVGGRFLAPKGAQLEAELAAAQGAIGVLGGQLVAVEEVAVIGEPQRSLVVIAKVSATPDRYPRAAGIPQKRPLAG